MNEPLVIVQYVGSFDNKAARAKMRPALRLPDIKVALSTVAIVHFVNSMKTSKVLQYEELVFAQPNEIGLKVQENTLIATPFSSHPFGMAENPELLLGETARFEWRRLIENKNVMLHRVINVAFITRSFSPDIFLKEPNHLVSLELS